MTRTFVTSSATGSPAALVAQLEDIAAALVDGPVAIISGDLVAPEAVFAPIVDDPFAPTCLLTRATVRSADVRVRHHVVTSVGTGFHTVTAPDHQSVGALRIAAADAPAAIAAIDDLREALASGDVTTSGEDAVELLALALVRSSVTVRSVPIVDVPWFRKPADEADARRQVDSVSAERVTRLQANRLDDGFYSTFVVRKLSKPLTRVALRLGLSPNSITLLSFAIGIGAAACFALGSRWALVAGAILLQVSLIVDCVDGEVARATRKFSALGAWLDASTDRVKEFLAYAGLAVGAALNGVTIWWLAVLLVLLQTTRHMSDYDFSRVQRMREAHVPRRDITAADDGAADSAAGWSVGGAMELSTRMNRRDAVRWFKRAIHMPIGERWLVISVMAAFASAAWALGTLLVLGLLAFAYVLTGRVLRTFSWRGPTPKSGALILSRQADAGPILAILSRLLPVTVRQGAWESRFGWGLPAALRFLELGIVALVALVWIPAAATVAFCWMAVVAFHHYDVLYRALQDHGTPRWLTWSALGWDGRTLLVLALSAAGVLTALLGWLAGLLSIVVVVVASVQWLILQGSSSKGGT